MLRKALVGLWTTCVFFTPHVTSATVPTSTPYTGTPAAIPGQINADSFDNGGEGVAYYDTTPGNSGGQARATDVDIETSSEGGYDVGWIAAGEWMNYTVAAPGAGIYSVQLRVASPSGASMHVGFNGPSNVWSVVSIPATGGWQNWTTVTLPVTLGAGTQQMTLLFDTGGMNLEYTTVTSAGVTSLPAPWSNQDVGTTGLAGSASFAGALFTVKGAGADIWGTNDAFQFVSQAVNGNAQFVARVTSLQNVNTEAKAGLMFRDTAAATSANVLLDVRPNGSIEFMSRAAAGAATTFLAGGTQPLPAWLRLTRSGTTFTGEVSADGSIWTLVGSTTVTLAANGSTGLAVTSHDATQLDAGRFDNVSVTLPPGVPGLPTPFNTASGIALSTPLTWTAAAATSYDVNFGTGNPPPPVATGLTSALFVPSALTSGTTYSWQVIARNGGGATAGPVWSFTAMVATEYNAITDRTPYVKPAPPQLGPAGFTFVDPTFGSNMLRVTDGNTRPGLANRSFRMPSNAHLAAWNASSTAFYVISNDGTVIPYAFNAATMSASRIQATATADGGATLAFYDEPQFSRVDPNVIYGAVSGSNNLTISAYNFGTGTYAPVVDLSTLVSGITGTYVGGIVSSGAPTENLMTFFGGAAQDLHYYALWMPIGRPGGQQLLNTVASTINGVATNITLNFHLHSGMIDKSGRFVFLYPTAVDLGSPRFASQVYIWDTASGTVTAITSGGADGGTAMLPGGHDAAGYGTWVNQDCCTSSSWDAAQWQFRALTSLAQTSDLISPILSPKEVYLADHTTWNNAQPATLMPVVSSTYRYGDNTAPWRAWDDEIIAIQTAGGGGGIVWRFAHHRSLVASDTDSTTPYFWYEPIANVSPDGKWVLFTSNWEKTLGTDSSDDSAGAGTFRQDVFVVQLALQP